MLKAHPEVAKALEEGKNMRAYTAKIETDLKLEENSTLQEFLKNGEIIASLYRELTNCDKVETSIRNFDFRFATIFVFFYLKFQVLELLDDKLSSFQKDLHKVGNQISVLQTGDNKNFAFHNWLLTLACCYSLLFAFFKSASLNNKKSKIGMMLKASWRRLFKGCICPKR